MSELRDYAAWHRSYDDPGSDLSWRLDQVRRRIHRALDEKPGQVRVLSVCAGDGRDVLGVLGERDDADRVSVTLLEVLPGLVERARGTASSSGLARVDVRMVDAGRTASYAGAVPADVVLLVGIFGNISDADVARTIAAAPAMCAPGALLLWSRGLSLRDPTAQINEWFTAAGFIELEFVVRESDGAPSLGSLRFDGPPAGLASNQRLFTFIR